MTFTRCAAQMENEASGNRRGTKAWHEKWKFVERRNADERTFASLDEFTLIAFRFFSTKASIRRESPILRTKNARIESRRRADERRGARVFVRSTRAVSAPVVNEERRWNGKKRKASQ